MESEEVAEQHPTIDAAPEGKKSEANFTGIL
jgi:hypothetical protein